MIAGVIEISQLQTMIEFLKIDPMEANAINMLLKDGNDIFLIYDNNDTQKLLRYEVIGKNEGELGQLTAGCEEDFLNR